MAGLSLAAEWLSLCDDLRQVVAASPGRTLRIRCSQVARKTGLSPRRVRSFYEGGVEIDQVGWEEGERLRNYLSAWRTARTNLAAAEGELRVARARFRADAGALVDALSAGAAAGRKARSAV